MTQRPPSGLRAGDGAPSPARRARPRDGVLGACVAVLFVEEGWPSTEHQGRPGSQGGRVAGPEPGARSRLRAAAAGTSAPGPNETSCLPGCRAAAAGEAPRHAGHRPAACIYPAAQPASCLLHSGRLSRADRAPVSCPPPTGRCPSHSHHRAGQRGVTHRARGGQCQRDHGTGSVTHRPVLQGFQRAHKIPPPSSPGHQAVQGPQRGGAVGGRVASG